jgi:hypothetical protein
MQVMVGGKTPENMIIFCKFREFQGFPEMRDPDDVVYLDWSGK